MFSQKEKEKLYSIVQNYGLSSSEAYNQSKIIDKIVVEMMKEINVKKLTGKVYKKDEEVYAKE